MDDFLPLGYAQTMNALARPEDWDVPRLIADISENLRRGNPVAPGQVLAVIDTLSFRMKDIAELIAHGHARRIDPTTLRQAAEIAATFVQR